MPANNIEIAPEALDSFVESHGHQLHASGSQQNRILVEILGASIEIADHLGKMAGIEVE